MGDFVSKDNYVMVNLVDLSDHVESVSLPLTIEEIDDTCMGDDSRVFLPGLKNGSLSITFKQDFAAAKVDATLWGVYNGGVVVAIKVRPTAAAISVTNPEYQFDVVLTTYPPLDGTVGEGATITVAFQLTGDVARKTTAG